MMLDPHQALERKQAHETLYALIDGFPERTATVLKLRYGWEGEPQTLRAVAQAIGVSNQRVRQLQETAMRKLQSALMRKTLAAAGGYDFCRYVQTPADPYSPPYDPSPRYSSYYDSPPDYSLKPNEPSPLGLGMARPLPGGGYVTRLDSWVSLTLKKRDELIASWDVLHRDNMVYLIRT
jgi:hypothetical protein